MYGRKIDSALQRGVNKAILDLRVTDKMREIVDYRMGGKNGRCASPEGKIGAEIVGIPLSLLVGPCLVGLVVVLFLSWNRRSHDSLEIEHDEFDQPTVAEAQKSQGGSSLSRARQRDIIDEVLRKRK